MSEKPAEGQVDEQPAGEQRIVVHSFKARADAKRTLVGRLADWMTGFFGSITFLLANALVFAAWIIINTNMMPQFVQPFDPYPFGLLTTIVSLEAIFLAIIVLISQNRAARIGDLREEVDLKINSVTEAEVTKAIHLLVKLLEKQGVTVDDDPELKSMLKPLRAATLEQRIEKQLNQDDKFLPL